jgi:hypothetical protein
MDDHKRVKLLSDAEIDAIYTIPVFNEVEQSLYFEFSDQEITVINKYRTVKAKVYFMLSLGYFKAQQQFYQFDLDQSQDAHYIITKYFSNNKNELFGCVDDKTYRKQKNEILALLDYRNWSSKFEPQIKLQLCKFLQYYPKAHSALRQLLCYFEKQQIVIPTYRKLQDIFTAAFVAEEKRLNQIILSIPKNVQESLSALIDNDDAGISQLNIIRADQKDFQYIAVKTEVEKAQSIVELYKFSKKFISTLKLSKNAISYYAEITEQYAPYRLRRLSKPQQWLHTICFVHHRYQQIMDNLIISFIYHVRSILDAGKTFSEIALMEHSAKVVVDFPKLARFLKWFPTRDKTLTHEQLNAIAYNILPKTQFSTLAEFLDGNTFDKKAAKWQFYLKSLRIFSLYLRPILMTVDFVFYKEGNQIIELINILKTHYASGKGPSKLKFSDDLGLTIPRNMTKYLKRDPHDKQIDPYLLEFFVYQKMYHHLNRGRLCCNDSISYRDIDCDLVNDAIVDDVEEIAKEFGYPKIPVYCDKRLDEAIASLDVSAL